VDDAGAFVSVIPLAVATGRFCSVLWRIAATVATNRLRCSSRLWRSPMTRAQSRARPPGMGS
jgi:hypothetical protein